MAAGALFLTEGGSTSGFGHIARCIALAQAFTRMAPEFRSEFLVDGDERVSTLAAAERVPIRLLDWRHEIDSLLPRLPRYAMVVVDSYRASGPEIEAIAAVCGHRLLLLDDHDRFPSAAGTIVQPAVCGSSAPRDPQTDGRCFSGPDYVLLREPFWRTPSRSCAKSIRSVLLSLGGSRLAARTIDRIAACFTGPTRRKVVVLDPRQTTVNASEVMQRMLEADVCLSAGGTTSEELACLGVPAIGIAISRHQVRSLQALHAAGCLRYVGEADSMHLETEILEALEGMAPTEERRRMSRAGRALIDGQGALRVAREMNSAIAGSSPASRE